MTLHKYAAQGEIQKMQELLDDGVEIDKFDDSLSQMTPLMCAAQSDQREAVRLLIKRGAQINMQSPNLKMTALDYAVMKGLFQMVQDLVEAGANLALTDLSGRRATDLAVTQGYHEIAEFLENWRDTEQRVSLMPRIWQIEDELLLHTTQQENEKRILDLIRKAEEERPMRQQTEEEMQSKIHALEKKIDKLEALAEQQGKLILRMHKDLDYTSQKNLELVKLYAGEPDDRALKLLKKALRNQPIIVDFPIEASSTEDSQKLLEVVKFSKKIKNNKRKLSSLLANRQRLRTKMESRLLDAVNIFLDNNEEMLNSIENYETKIDHAKSEMDKLQSSVDKNVQSIKQNGKIENSFCDVHKMIKEFTSCVCHHRVCVDCVDEEKQCGNCETTLYGEIKQLQK